MTDMQHEPASGARLTNEAYWNTTWSQRRLRKPGRWERHPAVRAMIRLIDGQLALLPPDRRARPRILEVGCADSYWLPFLARTRGADVTGVDFSEIGCEQAREQLARQQVQGTVVCGDFFAVAPLGKKFDLVISFGFIEHFEPPSRALAPMLSCLSAGGRLYAVVPNLHGVYGPLQWLINPSVYHAHVRLTQSELHAAALAAGLDDVRTGYSGGPLHFGVLNFAKGRTTRQSAILPTLGRLAGWVDRGIDALAGIAGARVDTPWFSPHAYVVGRRSAGR